MSENAKILKPDPCLGIRLPLTLGTQRKPKPFLEKTPKLVEASINE
jgi:hypothetical protein